MLGNINFLTGFPPCGSLTNPANGYVDTPSGTTFGSVATYSCDTGYHLNGDSTRACVYGWTSSAPTCVCKFSELNNNLLFQLHVENYLDYNNYFQSKLFSIVCTRDMPEEQ